MRLGRAVFAGLLAGAVVGFLAALLRPRCTRPVAPGHPGPTVGDQAATGSRPPAGAFGGPAVEPVVAAVGASREPAASVSGPSRRIVSGTGPGTGR